MSKLLPGDDFTAFTGLGKEALASALREAGLDTPTRIRAIRWLLKCTLTDALAIDRGEAFAQDQQTLVDAMMDWAK